MLIEVSREITKEDKNDMALSDILFIDVSKISIISLFQRDDKHEAFLELRCDGTDIIVGSQNYQKILDAVREYHKNQAKYA